MKNLIAFLILSVSLSSQAHICDDIVRAVTTDQKDMVMAVTLNPQALGLSPFAIYSMEMTNYVSWKENQVGCLADVLHRADIEVKSVKGPQLCTTKMTLHRKDEFVSGNGAAVYKIRERQDNCTAPSPEERTNINKCAAVACPYVGENPTFPDFKGNCECKFFDEVIQLEEEWQKYEDFYNPEKSFAKPEGVESPFTAP